jgi:predicted HicB family RNase H-like nuclease
MSNRDNNNPRKVKGIRMQESVHHRARVAALSAKMTLGQWIEEAIKEKIQKDPHPDQLDLRER